MFAAALEAREVPAVYTVTSLGDSGLNTLRNAINSANISVGADTINISVSGTITLTTGSLDITDAVTIVGPGVSQLTIKNGATDRIFNTSGAAAKSAISLSGMTITGGKPAGGGGGIFVNDESLTLNNCKVSGNLAQADGGAILVGGLGSLTLGNCTITGNTANGVNSQGGGLAFSDAANVVISQSLISGNIAGSDGGGVYFFKNGTLLMDASAVINNETAGDGAGIYAFGASFTGNVYNTTISGNTTTAAGHSGGGIMLKGLATLNLKNSTIVDNTATSAGGGAAVVSGTLNFDSTVIANNKATTGTDISGTATAGKSFVGVTTGATIVGTALTGNPQLSLLGFWGGPQPGYKPLVGSPLINAGANPAGLAFDQRGVSRTIGAGTDIGSIEFSDTLYVTNTADSGAGSLRRAVDDSNIDNSIDTITFDPTLFATPQKLSLFSEIDVTDSVVVQGPGNVTVNAVGVGRHFNIDGANKLDVTLSGMTLFNGKVTTGNGGAVRIADENVTLSQMTLIGNSAPAGSGGAIAVESSLGKLQLDDCVFTGNSVGQNGGAISTAHTTLNLYRTHLANNTAGNDGGGIYMPSGGTLSVTSSAITGNVANTPGSNSNHGGGGIFFYGQLGTSLDILNSTISSNRATSGQGGGVMILGFNQTATVRNSTITANTAGPASRGGGIMCFLGAGLVQLDSSIVAGNVNGLAPDIYSGGTVTANFSAVGSKTGIGTFTADTTTNGLLGADLKLGALADNGGPTPTHLPAIDSPVVNKGSNPASAPADQRGAGYGRARTGTPDIGAVEAPTTFVVTNANNSGAGSLRQAVLDANAFVGADTINFDTVAFVSPQTITLTGTGLGISEAVAIVGPGPTRATISGGNAVQIINATATLDNTVVSVSGLTFTQGKSAGGGGAIAAQGQSLVLDNCVFTNNFATSGGGAILTGLGNSYDGGLTANDCVFINNSTVQRGGAIFAPGGSLLALNRCTLSGNQATSGGAIYGFTNFTLDYCTVSGNQASGIAGGGIGGGVYISLNYFSPLGAIRNSTISGNKAQTDGGGLHMGVSPGMMLVQNSTIVNNTANAKGGGIIRNSGPTLNVVSSIVSNNQGTNGPDIYDPFAGSVSVTFSAIGNAQGFTLNGNNNLPFGTNLLLGPLANNGGPTQTHRPLVGSPLIDSSSNIVVFGTDQRGVSRSLGKGTDIGAVETAYELVVTNSLGDGLGSLRQCVSDANNDAGMNTITFDPLAFATPQSIRSNGGEIAITESVAIYGPGSSMATIDAKGANRVFRVDAPGSGNVVTITGLTIAGGSMLGGSGGGIYLVDESLTLTDCVISGNTASSSGGGIATGTATLTLNNCTVANNATGSHGGGLSVDGTAAVVVQNSTFFGNSSYFAGGGIDIYNGGSLLLSGSTISGNSSNSVGGGVYFGGPPSGGGFVVRNSTFSGNSAGSSGGGIAVQSFSGSTTVQNSTFTANSTLAGKGGGIAVLVASHALAIESSILSGNATNVGGPDISSPGTVTVTSSLLGSLAGITTFVPDAISTLSLGKNPLLGPLANNGGPTKTHALLPGSPAINNGSNPTLQINDQRGAGFVRVSAGSPDMGAFEAQPAAKIASVVINNGDAQRSRVTKITINFDQLVTFADAPVAAFKLKRQSDNAYVGLTAAVNNGATTSVDLTFNDAGSEFGSLTDGRYTLSVLAAPAGNFDGNGDGTAGDDYTLVGDPATNKLFRLYGDADGSGQVNATDFLAFRLAFLSANTAFDFNYNGQVDASDLLQFRLRFLQSV